MARRRPLTTFLLLAYGIGWPALMVPVVTDLPPEPFLLVLLFLALLALVAVSHPAAGMVRINGRDLGAVGFRERRKLFGYAAQGMR